MLRAIVLYACGLLMFPAAAGAHFSLVYPSARYPDQFGEPCGRNPDTGRDNVTVLQSGSSLTISATQTIGHPGYFRVSFDADGQNDFVNPPFYGVFYIAPSVLLDNIPVPPASAPLSVTITLPNIECSNCTLQVLEVLSDHYPPWGDGDDLHYQCADLVLVSGPMFENGFESTRGLDFEAKD